MKRRLPVTMDQQAPGPSRHPAPDGSQWLSIRAHRTKGGTTLTSKASTSRVRIELNQPLNRFWRIQPSIPTEATGGLICALRLSWA